MRGGGKRGGREGEREREGERDRDKITIKVHGYAVRLFSLHTYLVYHQLIPKSLYQPRETYLINKLFTIKHTHTYCA